MSRAEISYILHLHLYLGYRLSLLTICLKIFGIMLVKTFYHRQDSKWHPEKFYANNHNNIITSYLQVSVVKVYLGLKAWTAETLNFRPNFPASSLKFKVKKDYVKKSSV